jgi:thioredoxin 1
MSTDIVTVTDQDFQRQVLRSDLPVLVDFWAEWCGPCHLVAPVVVEIAAEQVGKLRVVKLNVDDSPETALQWGVMSIPTLVLFSGGVECGRVFGALGKEHIVRTLLGGLIRRQPVVVQITSPTAGSGGLAEESVAALIQRVGQLDAQLVEGHLGSGVEACRDADGFSPPGRRPETVGTPPGPAMGCPGGGYRTAPFRPTRPARPAARRTAPGHAGDAAGQGSGALIAFLAIIVVVVARTGIVVVGGLLRTRGWHGPRDTPGGPSRLVACCQRPP